ncbi:MAG: hypothetical protein OSB33_06115 [Candidatus Poseidoniales archaeon]|nr:hypothetical protein [Candidatus Poseidoniales archaeon]
MDWKTVELVSISDDEEKVTPAPILAGLSAEPSHLHDAFLSDLPHLAETQAAHANLLTMASEGVEAHFAEIHSLQTADIAIANLGGFREGDSLVLPLSGAIQDRVQLEMNSQGDWTTLRLNAEGNEGVNFTRTFTLPLGTELGRAGWRGNQLVLDLVRD